MASPGPDKHSIFTPQSFVSNHKDGWTQDLEKANRKVCFSFSTVTSIIMDWLETFPGIFLIRTTRKNSHSPLILEIRGYMFPSSWECILHFPYGKSLAAVKENDANRERKAKMEIEISLKMFEFMIIISNEKYATHTFSKFETLNNKFCFHFLKSVRVGFLSLTTTRTLLQMVLYQIQGRSADDSFKPCYKNKLTGLPWWCSG